MDRVEQKRVVKSKRILGLFTPPKERPYLAIVSLKTGEIVQRIFVDHSVGVRLGKPADSHTMIPAG